MAKQFKPIAEAPRIFSERLQVAAFPRTSMFQDWDGVSRAKEGSGEMRTGSRTPPQMIVPEMLE
jgi:hypothetical protein